MSIKVLIACEQSQTVCAAFRRLGIEAYSNDILRCYGGHPEWHIMSDATQVVQGNGRFMLESGECLDIFGRWDLIIAHPPCTMLTHSSAVAYAKGLHTGAQVEQAKEFFMTMLNAPADHVAVENPAPMRWIGLPIYDQIIQPYQFGERYSKRVCLWLRDLPHLIPVRGYRTQHDQWLKHCSSRSARRAKTFELVAEAMAENWGTWVIKEKQRKMKNL